MIATEILRQAMVAWDLYVAKPLVRIGPKKSGKRILCFGDSNTWGSKPGTGLRYPFHQRWPGVLQRELGESFVIIEEGRNGRTTRIDDPDQRGCNGLQALKQCLEQHQPLDLVIILLGTNDLKISLKQSTEQIAEGMEELGGVVLSHNNPVSGKPPKLLLMSPPVVIGAANKNVSFHGVDQKSALLMEQFQLVADRLHCEFLDVGSVIQSSVVDGVHWDKEAHQILGETLGQIVYAYLLDVQYE